jgi:hypothetical protein
LQYPKIFAKIRNGKGNEKVRNKKEKMGKVEGRKT